MTHLRRHVVGYLALMLALSGTAFAMGRNSVGSQELAPNSVGSSELQKGAVDDANVKNGSLGSSEFGDDVECGYLGEILLVGFDVVPKSTTLADGSTVTIASNQALFSVYGNAFGGDPNATPPTFAVPKLTSTVAGTQYVLCTSGFFPSEN